MLEHPQRCSVCDPAKIFVTSKFSYLLFSKQPVKLKLGLEMDKSIRIDSLMRRGEACAQQAWLQLARGRERERERESALSLILQTEVAKFGVGVHITGWWCSVRSSSWLIQFLSSLLFFPSRFPSPSSSWLWSCFVCLSERGFPFPM